MGEARSDRPSPDLDRLTVAQAAVALNISQDAVRKRIARGTISHDKDESGRVVVYLAPSETVHKTDQDTQQDAASKTVQDTYIRSLEDQIAFLRRELERKDAILLNLTERIPELEAPSEERESPQTVEEAPDRAEPPQGAHNDTPGPLSVWFREAGKAAITTLVTQGVGAVVAALSFLRGALGVFLGVIILQVLILAVAYLYVRSRTEGGHIEESSFGRRYGRYLILASIAVALVVFALVVLGYKATATPEWIGGS